ncbi:hypothetical protein C1645_731077 [Glomus cerebriforme]|uniref:Uncharacterized protein n=1 Tax=Glomus cerebriforme TaxID=658196 RepID=A0A397TPC1_9GLOM|nr:hypothetical protein C1645_731077 [Glomus cerebriforme]
METDNSFSEEVCYNNQELITEVVTVPANSVKRLNGKLLEEKKMDNFLVEMEALYDKNKIGEKKARNLIYNEVIKQLNILHKKRSQDTRLPLSDISRDEISPSNSLEAEDDYYKILLEDYCAKDCDSAPHNSEEEMPDDSDDRYNGYGRYNEYSEHDRSYYYRDGRYKRNPSQ